MTDYLCRVSGSPLRKIMDFGLQPLGNGFKLKGVTNDEFFFDMSIGFSEESFMVQLLKQPNQEIMFHDEYAFFSSTSNNMKIHFKDFAEEVIASNYIEKEMPFVVELGCNDGILLKNFAKRKIKHLGIEPSKNVALQANENGVDTISEFFTENLADKLLISHGRVDAFLAANVMCHISDILSVIKGMKKLLKPNGVVIFEEPYLGDIITKNSYDQIYDEHVFLFSLFSVKFLFGIVEMELIDATHQDTHGGSMRYVIAHKNAYPIKSSVEKLLDQERAQGLDKFSTFANFRKNVEDSKNDLVNLLKELKSQGKSVAGYAATSKSTTILNYCGIGPDLIDYICDTTPIKQGKFSPGMHIPIVPHEYFVKNPPDFAFLFAWNHADEVMAKERAFVEAGGKWITHVPKVRVL
jgi:methylation protein EvaC